MIDDRSEERSVVGPVPKGVDPDTYDRLRRRALWTMPSGLYVLGSCAAVAGERRRNLMTCNWATQVSTSPKLVGISVEEASVTRTLVDDGGVFALSILRRRDRAVVRRFVKPVTDVVEDADGAVVSMAGQAVFEAATGAPVLTAVLVWVDCRLRHRQPLGSHVLYVGEVVGAGFGEPDDGIDSDPDGRGPLRMEDTRMNYGG